MKHFVIVVFLLIASAVHATALPDEYYDQDVQQLIKTEYFAFGGVGYAGRTSRGEEAFGAIVKKKEAIRYMMAAFEHGNDCARCYALVALRESSPQLYHDSLAWFRKHLPKKIQFMSGCIMDDVDPREILTAIEAGRYADYFKEYEAKKG